MFGIFSLSLSVAMVRKAGISVVGARMSQVYKLVNHLDALKSVCILQLCFWHTAEALKAQLIKKMYFKEIKE